MKVYYFSQGQNEHYHATVTEDIDVKTKKFKVLVKNAGDREVLWDHLLHRFESGDRVLYPLERKWMRAIVKSPPILAADGAYIVSVRGSEKKGAEVRVSGNQLRRLRTKGQRRT